MTEPTAEHRVPTPLTDLRKRVNIARQSILDNLEGLVGPVEVGYDFYREWNGCWKVRVTVSGAAKGTLDCTLLDTPGGGILALPRPLPERWRTASGVRASDGTRWTLDGTGALVPFAPSP